MTEPLAPPKPGRRARRPGPAAVVWGSVALFAVLFALLTSHLAATTEPAPRPVLVRKVIKRRVVTTVVPSPGPSRVVAAGAVAEGGSEAAAAPVEPVTTSAS